MKPRFRLLALMSALVSLPLTAPAADPAGPFQPEWDSLRQYRCPDWFRDAKFGIYAHWGVFSAAKGSDQTDWYGRNMYKAGHPNNVEHLKRYGSLAKFGYKDYIPQFTGEKFNADEWVDLYVESGAKFAGPVAEHADGFSMWDSTVNPWNAVRMGPKRDIVGEMEKAVRKRGLKFLVSLHHSWLWGWYPTWDAKTDCADPQFSSFYGPKYPATAQTGKTPGGGDSNMYADPLPSREWQQGWLTKVDEVVTRYSPDVLWFDNRMQILSESVRRQMAALFLNHAHARGQQPVLNYKRPDMELGTGTVDLERSRMPDIYPDPWLTDTSVSRSSWAYAGNLEYYSSDRLIDDLIDIVSKNGCMLLNVAPAPDGTIPDEQKEILRGIGRWLKVNGEAIYGSRPWLIYGEGPTQTPVGHLADVNFHGFTSRDIRFTTKDGNLYAIFMGWPEQGNTVNIEALASSKYSDEITAVSLVGHEGALAFKRTAMGLSVELPAVRPSEHAFTLRITRRPLL